MNLKLINLKFLGGIFLASFVLSLAFVWGQMLGSSRPTISSRPAVLGEKGGPKTEGCTTIQDGVLTYSPGHKLDDVPLSTGYDPYGYNYQAHLFNGFYANVYLGGDGFPPYGGDTEEYLAENLNVVDTWYWEYRDVELAMKWNDSWLSNKDCDGDDMLDRYYGYDSYVGSGAWETNHQWGTYEQDGKTCKWNYFVKIVAVPEGAVKTDGIWYTTTNGAEIGPDIWGAFATIQQIYNDPCGEAQGVEYLSPSGPGFGKWK